MNHKNSNVFHDAKIAEIIANSDTDRFELMVIGDSMYPKYEDGDIIIVNKKRIPVTGDDVIAFVNDCCELKRIIVSETGITLRSLFPVDLAVAMKTYSAAEVEALPVEIIGVVCEMRRVVKNDINL